jgi:MSHA biogenesis protein MshJ
MKEQWRQLAARFNGMMMRERVLVLLAAVVGTALVFDAIVLQPLEARKKRVTQQLADARQNIKTADALVKMQGVASDPEAVKRTYRDALRKQLAEIDQSMKGLQRGLVPPERMVKLLEEMLSRSRGLQLVSLRTLPAHRFETPGAGAPRPADKGGKNGPRESERTIYQHSFEITLQGTYSELHDYLAQLEKLPWQMFWGRISVNGEQHPRLRVMLTVQTLSLNKAWLIVLNGFKFQVSSFGLRRSWA